MIGDFDKRRIHSEALILADAVNSIIVSSGDDHFLAEHYLAEKMNVIKSCVGFIDSFTKEVEQ